MAINFNGDAIESTSSDLNSDDVFMRCVCTGVIDTFNDKIKWQNKFSDGKEEVALKYYFPLVGSERFIKDAIEDDVVGDARTQGPVNDLPRGTIVPGSITFLTGEFTNPYVRILAQRINSDGELKRVHGQLKSIPVDLTYEIEAIFASQIDTEKYIERFAAFMHPYRFFTFEYGGFSMDAVCNIPDGVTNTIPRQFGTSTAMIRNVKHSISVKAYLPVLSDVKPANTGIISTWKFSISEAKLKSIPKKPWQKGLINSIAKEVGTKPSPY